MMSKPKRLHPIVVLLNILNIIRHNIVFIVAGLLALREQSYMTIILIGLVVLILIVIFCMLSWYRFTYRIEADELRIEHGILVRKKRYISKHRIQSIDLTANVIHRLFKLMKVQIETAGSSDGAEATLAAVTIKEAELLREQLLLRTNEDREESGLLEKKLQPSQTISFKRLFIAGSTSGSIGVIMAIVAFGFSEIEQFIPDHVYDQTIQWLISLSLAMIAMMVCMVLFILWLLGIAGTMIKYGHFTITKHHEELIITRGLLEKKHITIPLKRIQAIGIKESILRQPLGFASIYAVVAGGSMDQGEDFPILFPLIKKSEIESFLQTFLPQYADGFNVELNRPPKQAFKYYLLRSSLFWLLVFCVIAFMFPQFTWIPFLLFMISLLLGVLRYQDHGFQVEEKRLTLQYRLFSKVTMVMYHNRIQACQTSQHKLQTLQSLSTIRLSIIGTLGHGNHYKLKDLRECDVMELVDWYSYRT